MTVKSGSHFYPTTSGFSEQVWAFKPDQIYSPNDKEKKRGLEMRDYTCAPTCMYNGTSQKLESQFETTWIP